MISTSGQQTGRCPGCGWDPSTSVAGHSTACPAYRDRFALVGPTIPGTPAQAPPQPDLHREPAVICRGSTPGYGHHGQTIIHAASETCEICREVDDD